MKSIALGALLIPSLVFGYVGLDKLEQAIINSDLKKVKKLIPKVSCDDFEISRFLDLSQQLINQRKSDYENQILSRYIPRCGYEVPLHYKFNKKEKRALFASLLGFLTGGAFLGAGLLSIKQEALSFVFMFSSVAFLAASVFLLTNTFINRALRCERDLKELYDNAIKIRALLWKCYEKKEIN